MGLRVAVVCGMIAAIGLPALARYGDDKFRALFEGRLVHIPLGGGLEVHWSWSVFCAATLTVWALLAVARQK